MFILADVVFSNEALGLVVSVCGTLAAALAIVWRADATKTAGRIARLEQQVDDLLAVLYRNRLEDEVPASVPHSSLPPRRRDTGPPYPHQ